MTDNANPDNRIVSLSLSAEELRMILQALGQFPYNQVSELIHHIQEEAGPQLVEARNKVREFNRNQAGGK